MNRRFSANLSTNKCFKEPPGIYRFSRLGASLREALEELLNEKKISPFLEHHIMEVFDYKVTEVLSSWNKYGFNVEPVIFSGNKSDEHYFIDGGWEIYLADVHVYNLYDGDTKLKKLKILASNWSDRSTQLRKNFHALRK